MNDVIENKKVPYNDANCCGINEELTPMRLFEMRAKAHHQLANELETIIGNLPSKPSVELNSALRSLYYKLPNLTH